MLFLKLLMLALHLKVAPITSLSEMNSLDIMRLLLEVQVQVEIGMDSQEFTLT